MTAREPSRRASARPTLEAALGDAGGVAAPRERLAGLRAALLEELAAGAQELSRKRSGYARPVAVAFAAAPSAAALAPATAAPPRATAAPRATPTPTPALAPASEGPRRGPQLLAVAPVDQALRADPGAVSERAWLLAAAVVGAMVQAAGALAPVPARARAGAALELRAGELGGWLALVLPLAGPEGGESAELAALAFEDESAGIDRLRVRAYAVPAGVLDGVGDVRPPIGGDHPLRAAEAVARLGGRPADEGSVAQHEEAVLALLDAGAETARPHDEQDPALRAARRILQRLAGMGKWGGYHTDFAHLARGFAGNERALASDVGERLLSAGLLQAKPSVGQRHVYLNPRRAGDIHALIERGVVPPGLDL